MKAQSEAKVKVVVRKSSPILKAAVVAALILCILAVAALHSSITQARKQYDVMRQQALALESDNQALTERIDSLGSLESAIRIAMEELGLTFPDSILYIPGK